METEWIGVHWCLSVFIRGLGYGKWGCQLDDSNPREYWISDATVSVKDFPIQ